MATAATALGACGPGNRGVQVMVVWSGRELELFRRVLRGYGQPVEVISAGDNIDALLQARRAAGTTPDVAVLSRPGLVADYSRAGWLEPLDDALASAFTPRWAQLLYADGALHGVWVKAAHKSLIWRVPGTLPSPPQDWPGFVTLVRDLAAATGPRPLAIGAADGWVLTDWLENRLAVLLSADEYDQLARGERPWTDGRVRQAFTDLAELWATPDVFPGGGRRALLTQNEESVLQVTATRQAAMVFEGDFVASVVERYRPRAAAAEPFRFPGRPTGTAEEPVRLPLVVGGDAAVVFRGSVAGRQLVNWLVTAEAFRPWVAAGGYLSPNRFVDTHRYPTPLAAELASQLTSEEEVRFDLSDRLPGALTGADGQGSWQILQDFFADVTVNRWAREAAVSRAVERMERAAAAIREAGR